MPTLEHMATFVQIVESGSIAGAARVLGVSQPAASRRLAALEEAIGAVLLVRTTRALTLTQAGEQFLVHCRWVSEQTERVVEGLRAGERGVSGRVVISAPVTYGLRRIAPALRGWHDAHPGLEVELRLEDRAVELMGEGVDIAVRGGMAPPDSAGLMARRIGRWGRVLVAAPSVEAPEQASALEPRGLLGHISAAGALRPWALVCGEARAEVTPGGPLRSNSLEALLSACEQGMGIALLPGWLVEPSLAAGRLARVAPGWSGEEVELWALHPAQLRWSARVRLCLELLARDAPQGQQNMP